jgi:hypothetical protein
MLYRYLIKCGKIYKWINITIIKIIRIKKNKKWKTRKNKR